MVIKCISCKKDKDESAFGPYAQGRRKTCNPCVELKKQYNRKNREHLLEMRRFRYHTDPERKTAKANKVYMQGMRGDPRRSRQLKNNHLARKYGITIEQYDEMITAQKNKCAICGFEFPESKKLWNRPCVDHCHRTNKVRGILCRKCNVMLYWFETNHRKEIVEEYLRVNGAADKEPLT